MYNLKNIRTFVLKTKDKRMKNQDHKEAMMCRNANCRRKAFCKLYAAWLKTQEPNKPTKNAIQVTEAPVDGCQYFENV